MSKRCVAYDCSNVPGENISCFLFPKDPTLRTIWTKKVQSTRANWTGPSHTSVLCSEHFTKDCFEKDTELAAGFGIQKRRRLVEGAIPTIFKRPETPSGSASSQSLEGCSSSLKRAISSHHEWNEPQKKRQAFEKRERSRIVEEALLASSSIQLEPISDPQTGESGTQSGLSHSQQMTVSSGTQPESSNLQLGSSSINTIEAEIQPKYTNSSTQVMSEMISIETQAKPEVHDVGVQCDLLSPMHMSSSHLPLTSTPIKDAADFYETDTTTTEEGIDDTYAPSEESMMLSEDCSDQSGSQAKYQCYLVFDSALLLLFSLCTACRSSSTSLVRKVCGSLLCIRQICHECNHVFVWRSQPYFGRTPAGNILTSAAILYTGAQPAKALRLFSVFNCPTITTSTFFRHQRNYLQPSIDFIWEKHQQRLLRELKESNSHLIIGGDGRADSPGHSAKFGSYSMVELTKNKVIDIKLVQSNEVTGSYHMEKEGLLQCMQYLGDNGLQVDTLITDRHKQINKWLRETYPSVKHRYDVWHVAKGLRKKLEKLAKQKSYSNEDVIRAKWLSLDNHVHNVHRNHGTRHFRKCDHGRLRRRDRKKWFKRREFKAFFSYNCLTICMLFNIGVDTKASEKLGALLTNTYLCNDMVKLSPKYQTSSVESFHNVIIHFAPKSVAFSYLGMQCRLKLAALHFNENANRPQAVTKEGDECYDIVFPKYKKGGYIVKKVLVKPTYGYIEELMAETAKRCTAGEKQDHSNAPKTPEALASAYERPDKAKAIQEHKSRFKT
ncbi:uncharacterized protein [Dysidea avara]|uniref:uncharacterized protein isoform X4 n=1 Tax=Dysidea avara TaxID=196820 RepID=UPI0033250A7D